MTEDKSPEARFDPKINDATLTAEWTKEDAKKWYYEIYINTPNLSFSQLFSFDDMMEQIMQGEVEYMGFKITIK